MTLEIRPIREEELADYRRVASTALMISPTIMPPEVIAFIKPEMTLCAVEDGKVATTYAWWPLKMYINGALAPVAGITFVGTRPLARRKGYLRKVTSEHFRRLHETGGQPIAALFASQAAIYQRYGYGIVSTRNAYDIEPRHLRFACGNDTAGPVGRLRELQSDEIDPLLEIYQTYCINRTGYLNRKPTWWAGGALRAPTDHGALFIIVYEEASIPLGYVIYTVSSSVVPHGQPWQQVTIRDMAWLTPAALQALWAHMGHMDLAAAINYPSVSPDDPLPHLLLEPRRLNISTTDGLLARIVDVARALPLRHYDQDGELNFQITDELCPWNAGNWRMTTTDKRAVVDHSNWRPDMTMPVDTLAMLFFGQITPSEAVRMGRATFHGAGEDTLRHWDRTLGTRHKPFCPDFF